MQNDYVQTSSAIEFIEENVILIKVINAIGHHVFSALHRGPANTSQRRNQTLNEKIVMICMIVFI